MSFTAYDRKLYCGGSDAPVVMGKVSRASSIDLWRLKLGKKEPEEANERMIGGNKVENHIADDWYLPWLKERFPGKDIELSDPGALFHPVIDWMAGTPDRICFIDGKADHLVEIKSHGHFAFTKSDYDLDDKTVLPIDKKIQGQYYLKLVNDVLGLNLTEVAFPVLWDTHLFGVWYMEHSPDLLDDIMEKCGHFMNHNVRNSIMPDPDGSKAGGKALLDMWRLDNGQRVAPSDSDAGRAQRMLDIRAEMEPMKGHIKSLTKEYDKLKHEFEKKIGDNLGITGICDWKSTKGRTKWEEVAKEAKCSRSLIRKHTTPSRSFSLKYKPEKGEE